MYIKIENDFIGLNCKDIKYLHFLFNKHDIRTCITFPCVHYIGISQMYDTLSSFHLNLRGQHLKQLSKLYIIFKKFILNFTTFIFRGQTIFAYFRCHLEYEIFCNLIYSVNFIRLLYFSFSEVVQMSYPYVYLYRADYCLKHFKLVLGRSGSGGGIGPSDQEKVLDLAKILKVRQEKKSKKKIIDWKKKCSYILNFAKISERCVSLFIICKIKLYKKCYFF